MNEWQYGIKKTFDDLAYEEFKKIKIFILISFSESYYIVDRKEGE